MPLTDSVLEILFSFLLEPNPSGSRDTWLVARPVSRLLTTRRTGGFEHVKMVLLKRGLRWAMDVKDVWVRRACLAEERLKIEKEWMSAYRNLHWEADRARINAIRGVGTWDVLDFADRWRGDYQWGDDV